MKQNIIQIRECLLTWYYKHQRALPWRETKDPYKIWVSEIILQQTQVKTGLDYYLRFISAFPNVETLAAVSEEEVLKLWQGLGYYSRARNMHFAAKQVMTDFNGIFPETYTGILSLKGIGEYTAAAISSIAFGLPRAVVDGNVIRVVSRLFGISDAVDVASTQKRIKSLADDLLDRSASGDFNQAMMEYGALQCIPAKPNCEQCQLKTWCQAYKQQNVHEIPFKSKKVKVRPRYFYYLVLENEDGLYLHRRTAGDIWQGLYEFPLLETEKPLGERALRKRVAEFLQLDEKMMTKMTQVSSTVKHVLSHQIIQASFFKLDLEDLSAIKANWVRVEKNDLKKYPVARIIHRFFKEENLIS